MSFKYTVIDLFAGAGGLSKAFEEEGAEIIWANDIDKNAGILFRENIKSDVFCEGDITVINETEIPDSDILVSGFPCQSFSIAGRNKECRNNTLFCEILRVLDRLKPKVFLLENVKGLVSHDNGKTLRTILEKLKDLGYYVNCKDMNIMDYGDIPYNKTRLYIVGFKNKCDYEYFSFPEPVELKKNIKDILDLNKKEDQGYYDNSVIRMFNKIYKDEVKENVVYLVQRGNRDKAECKIIEYSICPTIYAHKLYYDYLIKDKFGIRTLTPTDYFLLNGYSNILISKELSKSQLYRIAANTSSICVTTRIAKRIIMALDGINIEDNFKEEMKKEKSVIKDSESKIVYESKVNTEIQSRQNFINKENDEYSLANKSLEDIELDLVDWKGKIDFGNKAESRGIVYREDKEKIFIGSSTSVIDDMEVNNECPTSSERDVKTDSKNGVKIFYSYSHADENMRNELEKHLVMLKRQGIIKTWYDRKISAGSELDSIIDKNLKDSDIILLLISVDFLSSDYCYDIEMKQALKMHNDKEAIVIPVILRSCDWNDAPFGKLMALPTDAKSVSTWEDKDEAYLSIARGIKEAAKKLNKKYS